MLWKIMCEAIIWHAFGGNANITFFIFSVKIWGQIKLFAVANRILQSYNCMWSLHLARLLDRNYLNNLAFSNDLNLKEKISDLLPTS